MKHTQNKGDAKDRTTEREGKQFVHGRKIPWEQSCLCPSGMSHPQRKVLLSSVGQYMIACSLP